MSNVEITAEPRSDFGKGAARRLRRSGSVPAVIYGTGIELTHVALDEHEINLALRKPRVVLNISYDGSTYLTKPRDIQRDPVKQHLEHVDLVIITKQEAAIRRLRWACALLAPPCNGNASLPSTATSLPAADIVETVWRHITKATVARGIATRHGY